MASTKAKGQRAAEGSLNEVRLRGSVTGAPELRSLPSGDTIVCFRVSVRRQATAMTRGSRQTVDVMDCCAWAAGARRSAERLAVGDAVEVTGALRRRFFRAGGAAASRVEIEVARVARA